MWRRASISATARMNQPAIAQTRQVGAGDQHHDDQHAKHDHGDPPALVRQVFEKAQLDFRVGRAPGLGGQGFLHWQPVSN